MAIVKAYCKFCSKPFIKNYQAQKFCSLTCANRHNLNNKSNVVLPPISNNLAEFFGILLGDGGVEKYHTKIYLNRIVDADYANYVFRLSRGLFSGACVTSHNRFFRGTTEIQISSCEVGNFLTGLGFRGEDRYVPDWICKNNNFTRLCLRGLFDTEGSVGMKYFKGRNGLYLYKQLTFTNKNKNLLRFVENKLSDFRYKPTMNSEKNIYLSNRPDIERFLAEIGSSNPKIINKIKIKSINGFNWRVAPNGKAPVLKTGVL